jgi:hypothetical protein
MAPSRLSLGLCLFVLLATASLSGCGPANWRISAENKSPNPVGVLVEMGTGNSTAEIATLSPGKPQVMIAGASSVRVQAVTITQGETKQILKPLIDLKPGQHFAIVIAADGTATAGVK